MSRKVQPQLFVGLVRGFVASAIVGMLASGGGSAALAAEAEVKTEAKKPAETTVKFASIAIKGGLSEAPVQPGLFGQMQQNLRQTIERLEKAAADDSVSGIVLELNDVALGRARIGELRAAIARTRAAGKKVYAQIDAADPSQYLLATACDEITMPPSGTLMLPGVRAEVQFFKGLFDKLGVEADFLHVGAYKGAAEPLTRDGFSPEVRENLTTLVDDQYEQLVESIAKDRKLPAKRVRKLIDTGLFTAEAAKKAGLIDRIAYRDELEATLKADHKADIFSLVRGYGKKKVDEDFSGPMGMMKLMQAMMGGTPGGKKSSGKKIAIVYAVGAITTGKSQVSMFGAESLGSDSLIAALKEADEDQDVVAIVLRIDSPGGSALASDLIWRETQRIKKPIVASMGDTAASGGYYIAMGADKIYASAGTVTGSIGVVGGKLVLQGLMDKAGVKTEVIRRGKNSGFESESAAFSKGERAALQAMMQETYTQFTTKAAAGRKMSVEELEKLAGGQVWTGRMAQQNGLVDELGTLEDALAAARELGGLKADDKTEILELPMSPSFFESLFGDEDTEAQLHLPLGAALPELAPLFARVQTLRTIFRDPVAVVLPYQLEIK